MDTVEIAKNYWESSPTNDLARINSHWRGHGRITAEFWDQIGADDKERLQAFLKQDFSKKTFLEWGCGGGAKMAAIAPLFSRSYAIDISTPNLDECKSQLKRLNIKATLIHIEPDNPAENIRHLFNKIDVILCVAVIDHMPSKDYVQGILGLWSSLLKKNGAAMVEYRLRDDKRFFHKTGDYNKDVAFWTTFEHGEFSAMAKTAGFNSVHLKDYLPHCGYQYAILNKGTI